MAIFVRAFRFASLSLLGLRLFVRFLVSFWLGFGGLLDFTNFV
jgi:hypothetical protein